MHTQSHSLFASTTATIRRLSSSAKFITSFLTQRAAKDDLVRIVDESGEDYLYHKSYFVFVDFPPAVKKKSPCPAGRQVGRAPRCKALLEKWNAYFSGQQ